MNENEESLVEKAYKEYEFRHCLEYIVFWYGLIPKEDERPGHREFRMTNFYSSVYPVKSVIVAMLQDQCGFEIEEKNIDILTVVVA